MATIDVSQAERCGFLIKQGCPIADEDIVLITEQDVIDIVENNPSNVSLTNTNAPFSFNEQTQSGNIPISPSLSYNSTTKTFTWLRGNGETAQTFQVTFNGTEILTTTAITVGDTEYPIGTSVQALLIALAAGLVASTLNNITTSSTVDARYDTFTPTTGVTFPSSPIEKDIHIATFKNGIATYIFDDPDWSLVSFLSRPETVYGTTTISSDGLTLRFPITIPGSISGTVPSHATVNIKSAIGENWDFLDYTTSQVGVNYYVAPAVGNIIFNWSITK